MDFTRAGRAKQSRQILYVETVNAPRPQAA
jgi:hypothetical protein